MLVDAEHLQIFPTLVHRAHVDAIDNPGLNQRIVEIIAALHAGSANIRDGSESPRATVEFDWTSDADLHVNYPELRFIADAFRILANGWLEQAGVMHDDVVVTECWGNIVHPGGSTVRHHHRGSYLSGAYYPMHGPGGGDIVFHDPRGARIQLAPAGNHEPGHSVRVAPTEGLILLFPAWLEHSVAPNASGQARYSVASNIVPVGLCNSARAPYRTRLIVG